MSELPEPGACDCCGEQKETPNSYACLPHIVYDNLCDDCAEGIATDLLTEGYAPLPDGDPNWYLKRKEVV